VLFGFFFLVHARTPCGCLDEAFFFFPMLLIPGWWNLVRRVSNWRLHYWLAGSRLRTPAATFYSYQRS
jgi:hypothetical protein